MKDNSLLGKVPFLQLKKWKRYKSKKEESFFKFILYKAPNYLLIISFVPLAFLGFDETHEGLSSATQRLMGNPTLEGTSYVFNQYGPFWSIYLDVFDILFGKYSFVLSRLAMITFYLASGLFTKRIIEKFVSKKVASAALFFYLASYHIGYSYVPWASGLSTFLIILIASKMEYITKRNVHRTHLFIVGVLLAFICGTRLQVGICATVLLVSWISFNNRKAIYSLFIGLLSGFCCQIFYVTRTGRVSELLYDIFVWPFYYVNAETTTFTLPKYTMVITTFFVIVFIKVDKLFLILSKLSRVRKLLVLCGVLVTGITILINIRSFYSKPIYASVFHVTERRIFVSFCISIVIWSALQLVMEYRRQNHLTKDEFEQLSILFVLSLANMTQIFPLFDALHSWWSLTPSICLFFILFARKKRIRLGEKKQIWMTWIIILYLLVPFARSIPAYNYEMSGNKLIYVQSYQGAESIAAKRFFQINIPSGSFVLNLCADADVFFLSNDYFSASRFFVSWGTEGREMLDSNHSLPPYIVSCTDEGATHIEKTYESSYNLISTKKIRNLNWSIFKKLKEM